MPDRRDDVIGAGGESEHEPPGGEDVIRESREVEQREADRLVEWLAEETAPPDPADPANARFYDWLARDLRERQRPAERAESERRADAFAARVRAAVATPRLRLETVEAAPIDAPVKAEGSVQAASRWRAAVVVDHAVAAGVGRELWDEPAERWVELPAGVPDGRYIALTVAGESMTPALHDGDVVLVRLGPELTRGAVVVARHPDDGYVVKRVGSVGEREIELRSLNPAFTPVRIPRDERLVVGTVVLRWCEHGSSGGADERTQRDAG